MAIKHRRRSAGSWDPRCGVPSPLGVSWDEHHESYNFALFSRSADGVVLQAFRRDEPALPVYEQRLDHLTNKTGPVWHCSVPREGLHGATLYGYRVEGPHDPGDGQRFDADKVLLDPYATEVFFPPSYRRDAAARPGRNDGLAPLGVLPAPVATRRWDGPKRPFHTHDAIVYELHVKGFTQRANSGVGPERRGTFAGLADKIPYLTDLGVTIVELLPVHQHDPQEGSYWGYMTLNFFAPHHEYAVPGACAIDEFRDMVAAFHAAGIEVWLDVVYNHTSEGDDRGPTHSFRGIDNASYYLLSEDKRSYLNDTGTGNTMRTAHPATRALVIDSLAYWAEELDVDGFRFDLASIFTRDEHGRTDTDDAPLIDEIRHLGSQRNVRLVAEAWDLGAYQLGRGFPGVTWLQWNGRFRDDLRSFVKSDPGLVGAVMTRLYGSDDLFPDSLHDAYRPYQSVNFVTAHDGFCLYDLVAYNHKHNEANGHDNTDGADDNRSWNCGWEGDVGDVPPEVLALRRRQVKNFCSLLLLANGTPMIVAGDEFMHTQRGNNNPYNQDNELTWLDWDRLGDNHDIHRFFRGMIAFRKAHRSIGRRTFWRGDVHWFGTEGGVDLSEGSRALAYFLDGREEGDDDLYVMINAYWEELPFVVQVGSAPEWLRVVDTSEPSPDDLAEPGSERQLDGATYAVGPRSVVVLRRPRERAATRLTR